LSGDSESQRLEEDTSRARNWKRWGPYLSERQVGLTITFSCHTYAHSLSKWGTVREDYSHNGGQHPFLFFFFFSSSGDPN